MSGFSTRRSLMVHIEFGDYNFRRFDEGQFGGYVHRLNTALAFGYGWCRASSSPLRYRRPSLVSSYIRPWIGAISPAYWSRLHRSRIRPSDAENPVAFAMMLGVDQPSLAISSRIRSSSCTIHSADFLRRIAIIPYACS